MEKGEESGSDPMSKTGQGLAKQDNQPYVASAQNEDVLARSQEHLDLLKSIAEKASVFDTIQKKAFSKVRDQQKKKTSTRCSSVHILLNSLSIDKCSIHIVFRQLMDNILSYSLLHCK